MEYGKNAPNHLNTINVSRQAEQSGQMVAKVGQCWTSRGAGAEACRGRPQKASVVRGLLFEWFSVLRNSVAARIPLNS